MASARALTLLLAVHGASAWLPSNPLRASARMTRTTIRASAVEESAPPATAATGPEKLKRERYVATNRFEVRDGKDAKFEKRWATRKSRLAELDGFRWFHLMRRVKLAEDDPDYNDPFNYVSFTIWQNKGAFNAWRNGEAFKEAHGGTSLTAFVGAMVSSLRVLKGAPRPAFYDGLMLQTLEGAWEPTKTVDGWRAVEADGVTLLPTEAFIACNNFAVNPGMEAAFEQRWAARESTLKECDGFVAFSMLRRDAKAKGHGVAPLGEGEANYVSTTIWKDRASFDGWRNGQQFGKAHGEGKAAPQGKGAEGGAAAEGKPSGGPPPMWARPPAPVFYEAKLVIVSPEGA